MENLEFHIQKQSHGMRIAAGFFALCLVWKETIGKGIRLALLSYPT